MRRLRFFPPASYLPSGSDGLGGQDAGLNAGQFGDAGPGAGRSQRRDVGSGLAIPPDLARERPPPQTCGANAVHAAISRDLDDVADRKGEIAVSAWRGSQRLALASVAAESGATTASAELNDAGEATLIQGAAAMPLLSSRSPRSSANRPTRHFATPSTPKSPPLEGSRRWSRPMAFSREAGSVGAQGGAGGALTQTACVFGAFACAMATTRRPVRAAPQGVVQPLSQRNARVQAPRRRGRAQAVERGARLTGTEVRDPTDDCAPWRGDQVGRSAMTPPAHADRGD